MIISKDNADKVMCPAAMPCAGGRMTDCAAWRWIPIDMVESGFKAALQKEIKRRMDAEPGLKQNAAHKDALGAIAGNEKDYGVRTDPVRGFCGLAGDPRNVK